MKHLFIILLIGFTYTGFAQQTVERESKLTPQVKEVYNVLSSDYNTRQGTYAAYVKKKMIAAGRYEKNKKVGAWTFFNRKGEVIQRYNFDNNTLLYDAPEDTTSSFRYVIDREFKDTDRITKPVKVGGRYYGYLRYLNLFKLPPDMIGISDNAFAITMELLVSPLGRLAEYKVRIRSLLRPEEEVALNLNLNLLTDEDKTFIPATVNGELVSTRVIIRCHLVGADRIDID
ncbi:hypothetical protein KHS38_04660 [Mucilaginibacter sp. Bleaf8]|uniref:hypothetical protein n=1 Tax=Mucilaginibacter sp. Bleaf8 TaxID=2834430 RepID=UPI001BCDFFC2|nr:hypothetical protein [Mucilaginibacter sp. Bleaf8]MBS7563689.1 hypothetical protein [Mucilaginibacter sp. Bleaf8]